MEKSQAYITPIASPTPNSLPFVPMTPMASISGSGCDTSSDRVPSTPGQASNLPPHASYDAEPINEAQESGNHNHNFKEINYLSFSYEGYGAPTPRCMDQSCTCHNNSQGDYFSREPTQEIASTSSQGDNIQSQSENGPELSNLLLPHHPVLAQADETQSFCAPADDAALFTDQGGWDLTELENFWRSLESDLPETEPAVISALRSISVQMPYIIGSFPSGEMLLPKLMDRWALKCMKDIVSLWATGRASMFLLNFLLDFCQNQGWFEERVWRNNNLGVGELRLLIMSERGRKESLKIWEWVSGRADWLRAFGLDVPSAEELDLRREQLRSLPTEFNLVNLRLRRDAGIVQVLYDDTAI